MARLPYLAGALQKELRRHVAGQGVTVFYVCGSDHFRKCGLHLGMRGDIGVVAVPRSVAGEGKPCATSGRERPDKLVYFATPAAGNVASYSSTKVRQALKDLDVDFVHEAISETASQLLLRPEPQELAMFSAEYKKLGLLEIVQTSVRGAADDAPFSADSGD